VSEHDPRDDYDDEPWRDRASPKDLVRLPASIMWVFGLLQCIITQLYMGVGVATTAISLKDDGKSFRELWQTPKEREAMLALLVIWVIATLCTVAVMRGANDLKKFRRYRGVWAGAILTLFSVPFFYLGVIQVPLGIWLIVLLCRRDVQSRFEAAARQEVNSPKVAEPPVSS
jgi:hypothetical protein